MRTPYNRDRPSKSMFEDGSGFTSSYTSEEIRDLFTELYVLRNDIKELKEQNNKFRLTQINSNSYFVGMASLVKFHFEEALPFIKDAPKYRTQFLLEQHYRCAICFEGSREHPQERKRRPESLVSVLWDGDPICKLTRGLLCHKCRNKVRDWSMEGDLSHVTKYLAFPPSLNIARKGGFTGKPPSKSLFKKRYTEAIEGIKSLPPFGGR